MCGITGFVDFGFITNPDTIKRMVSSQHHRGPDFESHIIVNNEKAQIGLGHSRLAIIDLSSNANQPFAKRQFILVYNGEIYNFKEIKTELLSLGVEFSTDSDTEVIIEAFDKWGILSVNKFIGMFAFCLYNKDTENIYIFRDRLGVKPIYYYWNGNLFLFGSELKAIVEHEAFPKVVDHNAVNAFMQYGYVPGPMSIYESTFKLEPGHFINISLNNPEIQPQKYWDVKYFFELPILDLSYEEAKGEVKKLLKSACELRMVADVPVGIFLSGGYDSTAVTALLQSERTDKLKTYTIGFPDGVNEAPFAEQIARILGTEHTTYDCTFDEAKAIIPELPYYYDEPNADISCIPTILISKVVRKEVKVALSADGGDEAFAGYSGYIRNFELFRKVDNIPDSFDTFICSLLNIGGHIMPKSAYWIKGKLEFFTDVLSAGKNNRVSHFQNKIQQYPNYILDNLMLDRVNQINPSFNINLDKINDKYNSFLYLDTITSMKDLLIPKVDRASMSKSLEVREPLLDHRIFEFMAQVPFNFKSEGNRLKIMLKDIVHEYVESNIINRPKTGFDLPVYDWLRTDMMYLIEYYLGKEMITKTGIFDYNMVNQIIQDFKKSNFRYPTLIWRMITIQMWYEEWIFRKAN